MRVFLGHMESYEVLPQQRYREAQKWLENLFSPLNKFSNLEKFMEQQKTENYPVIPSTLRKLTELRFALDSSNKACIERISYEFFMNQRGLKLFHELTACAASDLREVVYAAPLD
ncbi:MAG: hypothetical protein Tsb0015_15920 [Simkaniaceae bacterium]